MSTSKFFRKFSLKATSEDSPSGSCNVTLTSEMASGSSAIANPEVTHCPSPTEGPQNPGDAELLRRNTLRVGLARNKTLSDRQRAAANTSARAAPAPANAPHIAAAIEKGVSTFMETTPALIKTLDDVAKVHQFISVPILAFRTVYDLEVKRRSNDKKVIALYAEMRDMMGVLVRLKEIPDPKRTAPDGQTIEGRMRRSCVDAAEDIKRCANTCDTYLKKKLLVKTLAGPTWEESLLDFVEIFAKRRGEFEFALRAHTSAGAGGARIEPNTTEERTAEINQRVEVMREMFRKFVTPEQRQLDLLVEKKGGTAVIDNEQVMKELLDVETSNTVPSAREKHKSTKKFELAEIQREIREAPATAIEKNAEFFNRKFDIQRRQIQEDIERALSREGDRIISAVTGDLHARIADLDLRKIWKDMGWRGSVKARHFVLALKDHYLEMSADDDESVPHSDQWAFDYIGVNYVRSILEAFDDDASGFVTVKEANSFTRSRPQDWSLPHWIAYWAIGWQMTSTSYCEKIEEIFDAMISLSDEVLPENRKVVNEYIDNVWQEVIVYVRSLRWENGTEVLREKFESYVAKEEERLRKNLDDMGYNIDSHDVVRLISGSGRIETTLFPILYLLLERDLQKLSLACKHVLGESELPDALESIQYITGAAMYRVSDLRETFEQQNLSPEEQFAIYAKGLYNIASAEEGFHGDKLRELPDPIPAREEIYPDPDSISLAVLKYPTGNEHEVDVAAYDDPTPTVPPIDGPDAVLGTYYGFIYQDEDDTPLAPMIKWTLERGNEENSIVASGTSYEWGYHKDYTITGTTGPLEDGKMQVDLEIDYSAGWSSTSMTGHFDAGENSLRGTMTMSNGTSGEFVFKRDQDFVRFYPAPSSIDARERWKFATSVILDRIQRQSWSSSYVRKRIQDGKRYMELAIRNAYYGRDLDEDETAEYGNLLSSLYESDARFYASLINIKLSEVPIHPAQCDYCEAIIGGARILCMDCHNDTTTVDLCSETECLNSVITLENRSDLKAPHTPNHNMLKVHRILFTRDTARTEQNAKDALEAARETISEIKVKKRMPKCIHCERAVSLPCWYCVDCTWERFICSDCEHDDLAFNETHTKQHTLVRVIKKVEESNVSTEDRLKAVEGQLGSVQDELSKINQLLSKLFGKGAEGSPSDPLTKGDILDAAMAEPSLVRPPSTAGERIRGFNHQNPVRGKDGEGSDDHEDSDEVEDGDEDGDKSEVEDEDEGRDEDQDQDEEEDRDQDQDDEEDEEIDLVNPWPLSYR